MEIYSWNVNGIRSAWTKGLSGFFYDKKPTILCLQEIKANADQFPDDLREGSLFCQKTHFLYTNSAKKPGYAGVAILTKEKPTTVIKELGHDRFDSEGRMLQLNFANYSLINFYLPHGGRQKENLTYKLEVYDLILKRLESLKNQSVIVVGDFNIAHKEIDLARPKQNNNNIMFTPEERDQLNRLISFGYLDTLREIKPNEVFYTWWPYMANARERNLGWRIDYGFISGKLTGKLKDAFTCPETLGSDHCPIGIKLI